MVSVPSSRCLTRQLLWENKNSTGSSMVMITPERISEIREVTADGVQARFAMKSCPATRVLEEMQKAGIWTPCCA